MSFYYPQYEGYGFIVSTNASGVGQVWTGATLTKGKSLSVTFPGVSNTILIIPVLKYKQVTCTYDGNGGTPSRSSDIFRYNDSFPSLPTASRTGYTFNGWWTSASGGSQVKAGDRVTQTSDFTLYAHWTANTYTVTLNKNGGSGGTGSVTAAFGSAMPSATMPTYPGYTFQGYYDTSASSGGIQYYKADGSSARSWDKTYNTTLYARWTPNKELIITYNPNGGIATRYFDRVRIGAFIPALPSATWGSETTSRWFTSKTGGSEVRQGDTVTQTDDFTLYAHWSIPVNTHTLTFNANGGTVSPASRTLAEGAAYGTLPTPTRSGYTFVEWRTAPYVGTLVTSSTTMGTDDVTIYAIWRGNAITITLNANGGTVTPTTKSVENGSVYGILPHPTRSGFIFDGWWTAATGGTKIKATDKPSGNQTVYAHWKQDGGEVVPWVF